MKTIFKFNALMILSGVFILGAISTTATAQTGLEAFDAEFSLDFRTVSGKLLSVGDNLVFVNDDDPEHSFAINNNDILESTNEGSVLTIRTRNSISIGEDSRSRFSFRIKNGGSERLIAGMSGTNRGRSVITSEPVSLIKTTSTGLPGVYEARHGHRLYGSCSGRIVFGDDRISYESSDDREHSRQWLFTDIKKLKQEGPYKLSIKLFKGDGYSLEILGQGIDIADFKTVSDRLALVKSSR